MNDKIRNLEAFHDLPDEREEAFRIGDSTVWFSPRHEHGRVSGWVVTTGVPGYEGFLEAGRMTDWTVTGPEVMRTYAFEFRGAGNNSPIYMSGPPTDVTVEEFKQIYFGDYS